jgi:hypothetical protein
VLMPLAGELGKRRRAAAAEESDIEIATV